ncbi:hypothetical protein K4K56_002112 [Colletotrichum sp. SAR 10_98]|nr:hypothetical protein K4K56_002112 [Colletotrichum sp. SAR 10_98]
MPDSETDIPVSPTSSTEAVDGSSIDPPTSMATVIATMTLNSGPRLLMPGAGMDPAQAPAQVHGTSDGDQKPETVEAGTLGSQTMQANSHKSASPDKKKGRAIAHRSINNPHQEDVAEAPGKLVADEQPWTDEQYPVDSILGYRNTGMQVDLLVRWGGPWLHHEPTWEPEEDVWVTARHLVNRFWTPNGRNNRTRLLGLDPILGPFTVSRILAERKTNRRGSQHGQMKYLVDFVGYNKPEWTAASCLTREIIEEWKNSVEESHCD